MGGRRAVRGVVKILGYPEGVENQIKNFLQGPGRCSNIHSNNDVS